MAMNWPHLVAYFFGGIFLTNALPHFVAGLMGHPFQSPFAKPSGQGQSSSTVNVLWGFANLVIAYLLLCRVGAYDIRSWPDAAVTGAGMLVIGLFTARHFGRFNGGNAPKDG